MELVRMDFSIPEASHVCSILEECEIRAWNGRMFQMREICAMCNPQVDEQYILLLCMRGDKSAVGIVFGAVKNNIQIFIP